MHTDIVGVNPDTPVELAAQLMLDNKIGVLPVFRQETEELLGIVTQSDLLSVLAGLLAGDGPSTRLELQLDDLPRQLAQVAALAHQRCISIRSLITLPARNNGRGCMVVMRIGGILAAPFVAELRQLGIEVDLPWERDCRVPADH